MLQTKNDYPPNWPAIANAAKAAAHNRCENCAHPSTPTTGHTLTVHHLDGDKANNDDGNLVALCQRCHLHVQAKYNLHNLALQTFLPFYQRKPWQKRAIAYYQKKLRR